MGDVIADALKLHDADQTMVAGDLLLARLAPAAVAAQRIGGGPLMDLWQRYDRVCAVRSELAALPHNETLARLSQQATPVGGLPLPSASPSASQSAWRLVREFNGIRTSMLDSGSEKRQKAPTGGAAGASDGPAPATESNGVFSLCVEVRCPACRLCAQCPYVVRSQPGSPRAKDWSVGWRACCGFACRAQSTWSSFLC